MQTICGVSDSTAFRSWHLAMTFLVAVAFAQTGFGLVLLTCFHHLRKCADIRKFARGCNLAVEVNFG